MIAKVIEENGVKSLVSLSGNTVNAVERFPDWAHPKTITVNPWTADEDCYVECVAVSTGGGAHLDIDGNVASVRDDAGGVHVTTLNGFIKKGQVLTATQTMPDRCKVFPLLPAPASAPVEDDVYSTTETMTNKVWIDGKRIYRRTFEFTATADNQHATILPSGATAISCQAIGIRKDGRKITLPYIPADNFGYISTVYMWEDEYYFRAGTGFAADYLPMAVKLTVEYTKA